jgi:hypothetical protein
MRALLLVFVLIIPVFPVHGYDPVRVAADKLDRLRCPAGFCGIVGELSRGDELILLENTNDGRELPSRTWLPAERG